MELGAIMDGEEENKEKKGKEDDGGLERVRVLGVREAIKDVEAMVIWKWKSKDKAATNCKEGDEEGNER